MSHVAATFEDLYRQREEANDERRYQDDVQVNIRVGPDIAAVLDYLARDLSISRAAAGKHVLSAGIHDALDALDLVLLIDGEGAWAVRPKSKVL